MLHCQRTVLSPTNFLPCALPCARCAGHLRLRRRLVGLDAARHAGQRLEETALGSVVVVVESSCVCFCYRNALQWQHREGMQGEVGEPKGELEYELWRKDSPDHKVAAMHKNTEAR